MPPYAAVDLHLGGFPQHHVMTTGRASFRSANALRVFEVAARLLSFTAAASELHVTQVAVSRMVARLEEELGVLLFVRSRLGLQLTDDGAVLRDAVADGFDRIEKGFKEILRRQSRRSTVTLSLSSAFTSHWLMPRFTRFQQAVPDINLRFQLTGSILQGDIDEVDLGMRLFQPAKQLKFWDFCPEIILPVCSPDTLARFGSFEESGGSRRHALIHLTSTTMGWADYSGNTGLDVTERNGDLGFPDYALALQAALLGQGTVLGWMSAVSGALCSGLLVAASKRWINTGNMYCLVAKQGPVRQEVETVKNWLITEMQDDLAKLPGGDGRDLHLPIRPGSSR